MKPSDETRPLWKPLAIQFAIAAAIVAIGLTASKWTAIIMLGLLLLGNVSVVVLNEVRWSRSLREWNALTVNQQRATAKSKLPVALDSIHVRHLRVENIASAPLYLASLLVVLLAA